MTDRDETSARADAPPRDPGLADAMDSVRATGEDWESRDHSPAEDPSEGRAEQPPADA